MIYFFCDYSSSSERYTINNIEPYIYNYIKSSYELGRYWQHTVSCPTWREGNPSYWYIFYLYLKKKSKKKVHNGSENSENKLDSH